MILEKNTPNGVTAHPRHSRAGEFLRFIAENRAELWRAVKKNITYDPDLFDDAMAAAVVKVYNAIESGRDVADFKQYFFMAAKWEYINTDNATRRRKANNAPLSAADGEAVPTNPTADLRPILSDLRAIIDNTHGEDARQLYERHKNGEPFSKIGRALGKNPREIASMVHAVEAFVDADPAARQIRRRYYELAAPDE